MTKAEGKKFNFEDISKINSEFLQTFEFKSKDQYIKTETNEFSAVCPFSGLPDFCLLYTSPSPRDRTRSRMPSSA